ncbi:polycystic kidney disease protein 1-like 2 [Branchiostoma floridae]|uniref:Polycystic kidney disease protein 1-like 2 n=1 Tax=Branchiostoma floridae TaxID=7739 RepID=A0A9J7KUD5_BRAFL|nr:polycystic kidney disease protein 1-like 2 [Branchiostoma floridae]
MLQRRKIVHRRQREREQRVQQQRKSKTGKSFLSEHLWISVVKLPSSHFTRVQRISCCLSLLMSFMLVNIMFYRGDRNFVPRVTGGRVQLEQLFSWDTFIIGLESSLIALPINVIVVVLFRYAGPRHDTSSPANGSHPKGKNNYVTTRKDRVLNLPRYLPAPGGNGTEYTADPSAHIEKLTKQGALKKSNGREKHGSKVAVSEKPYRPLPWWSVIVAWFLVAAIVIVSGAFTVLYGNDYGRAKSQAWLLAFVISFLTDFILLQPVKLILVIIFFKLVTKKTKPSPETVSNIQLRMDDLIKTEWERRRRYLLRMDHDRRLRRPAAGPRYVVTANRSFGDGGKSGSRQEQHITGIIRYQNRYHPPPRHTRINTSNPMFVNVKDSKQHNMRQYESLVPRRR